MVWHDTDVINFTNLFEDLGNVGLVLKFDCSLCLWISTGSAHVAINNTTAAKLRC
jgi:hypothetical protein